MLTTKQEDLLIGSLLGDTHIEYNGKNCRARFDHSIAQLEYLEWKQKMCLRPFSGPISQYTIYDKRTQKTYKKARFSTYTLPLFNYYRELFYRKVALAIVPTNIKSIFHSSLALAVWYLDDGSLKTDCRAFKLHTNNFTLVEVEMLKDTLELNFDVKSKLHKQRNNHILYIGSKHSEAMKFSKVIRPLVESEIPSMLYKFF
jgi:hypothetical protein